MNSYFSIFLCGIFSFSFSVFIFNVPSYIFETIFTRNIPLWFSWMFSLPPRYAYFSLLSNGTALVFNCLFWSWKIYINFWPFPPLVLLSTQLSNLIWLLPSYFSFFLLLSLFPSAIFPFLSRCLLLTCW